jgi:hypothetical protein
MLKERRGGLTERTAKLTRPHSDELFRTQGPIQKSRSIGWLKNPDISPTDMHLKNDSAAEALLHRRYGRRLHRMEISGQEEGPIRAGDPSLLCSATET